MVGGPRPLTGEFPDADDELAVMPPYQFEHLVAKLLEEMGYDEVKVTPPSNDKGVDVIGKMQIGITSFTEVVQVKRHSGSIGRPVLDQLRGSLHRHDAIRGTIITIGKFSQGCKAAAISKGAPPIGLIDGESLLDLLFKHEVGVRRRPEILYELDTEFFSTPMAAEGAETLEAAGEESDEE